MTTFYVVTYGNGELLSQVFSAIAQALHGNNATFKTLFHLSLVLGSTWALVNMILQRNLLAGVQWLGIYYVAFYVLLLPASSVDIVDRINNTDTIVDNVPLGVAAMASYTSAIGDSVTHLVDSNFSFDEQLRYSQSGMAMSSALVSAASNFQIADPDFEQNLQAFLNQCVFYDVLGGKYTTKDLLTNTDLWGFVKGHASAIRTFLYDRSLTTCKDGATLLEGKWADVIQEMATRYGTRLFPDIQTNGKAADKLIDNLGISYHFLSDGAITADGRFLIQQNAMSNAIYNGILAWASRVGAGAAVSNGNFNRTVQQNRMSAQSTGQDMGSWVSMLKNVCEGISYGAFVIMILLMLFPIGWRLLKNYIYTLFWIQSWAPLYAIINMYVNYYAQHRTAAALLSLQAQGGTTDIFGISIITQASIAHINIDMISLAGYLCMSVPMIAAGLIKGGSMAFNGLMGHMNNASSGSGSDFATPHHAPDPGLNPTNTTPNSFDSLVSQLAYPKHTQGHDTPTPHNDFDQGIYHPNSLENTAKTGHFSDDHAGKSQLDPNHDHDPSTSPNLSETQKTTENLAHSDSNHQPSHHNDDGQSTSTNGLDTANIDSKHADNHANHAADDTHHAASHATSQHADSSGEARFIGAVTDSENHNNASANAHMTSNHSAPSHSENANEHSSASEHSGDSGSVNHGGENANTHLEDSGNANHASENSNHMPASQSMDTNHVAHDHASSEPASSGHPESNHLENPSQNSDPHFTAEPSDYLNHDATHNNAHSSSESSGTLNQDTAHLENHTSAHETDTAQSLQSTEREPEISTAFGDVFTDTSAQMCMMGEKSDQQITQDISQTHLENQLCLSSNDPSAQMCMIGDKLPETTTTNMHSNTKEAESRFDRIQHKVFHNEGGFVNNSRDKGGPTNKGITIDTFKRCAKSDLGKEPTLENLKKLTDADAATIYKKHFWDPIKVDKIHNESLAYAVYDFNVNAPYGLAVETLQTSANDMIAGLKKDGHTAPDALKVDGRMGENTLAVINQLDSKELFETFQYYRQAHYDHVGTRYNHNGLTKRVNSISYKKDKS